MQPTDHNSPQVDLRAATPDAILIGVAGVYGAALLIAAWLAGASVPVAVGAFTVAVALAYYGLGRSYPHDRFGACNVVTLGRAALVAFLCGALAAFASVAPWVIFGVASVVLAMDGIDGYLARSSGLCSDFGARFDMETDAALAAVLALWLLVAGTTGWEILVLGFTRYAFVAAGWIWPALTRPLPDSFARKVVCVVQIGVLLALVFPPTPVALHTPLAVGAAVLVVLSFARDTRWLLRAAT